VKIERYGLQWTVQFAEKYIPNNDDIISVFSRRYVFLKQNGLVFSGRLTIHPFHGPYIIVRDVVHKNVEYELPQPQWFFASELESMCNSENIRWYHVLQAYHRKSLFESISLQRESSKFWYVSLPDMLRIKRPYDSEIFKMLQITNHKHVMYVTYYKNDASLQINNNIYEQLQDRWTIDDLYTLDKDYQDQIKKEHEDLWCSIAKARAQHNPVQITAYDNNKNPILYTEKQMYGLMLPNVQRYRSRQ